MERKPLVGHNCRYTTGLFLLDSAYYKWGDIFKLHHKKMFTADRREHHSAISDKHQFNYAQEPTTLFEDVLRFVTE